MKESLKSLFLSEIHELLFPHLALDFAWPPCRQEPWQLSGPDVATFSWLFYSPCGKEDGGAGRRATSAQTVYGQTSHTS